MNKSLLILLTIAISSTTLGQYITFEDSLYSPFVTIDSTINVNNTWAIGQPQKTIFNSANSLPNAMVTDLSNTYPKEDSSVFYLWHTSHKYEGWWPTLRFWFMIDADSLNDFGVIEVSPDKGQTWINVISEAANYGFDSHINAYFPNQWTPNDSLPFTGSSMDWLEFDLTLYGWDHNLGYTDSILFRFIFKSDGIETIQDGWIIDNISMGEIISSVPETSLPNPALLYPNPTTNRITIKFPNSNSLKYDLTITDEKGQIVSQIPNIKQSEIEVDLSRFNSGVYFYQLTSAKNKDHIQGSFVKY